MKFFNYEQIYLAAHGDSTKIVEYFKRAKSVGPNFILNESVLGRNCFLSDRTLAEYIGLCSLRNYSEYISTLNPNLEISKLPIWVPLDIVKENQLIQLTDKQIIFTKENKNGFRF